MLQFSDSRTGRNFFHLQLPDLISALTRIADALESNQDRKTVEALEQENKSLKRIASKSITCMCCGEAGHPMKGEEICSFLEEDMQMLVKLGILTADANSQE